MSIDRFTTARPDFRPGALGILVPILLALALAAPPAYGQSTTFSQLGGSVRDQTGSVIPGVEITASITEIGLERTTITNDHGYYVIDKLPADVYEVKASLPGFKTQLAPNVELRGGQKGRVDFLMEPGEIVESITVVDAIATIETETPDMSSTLRQREMLDLPFSGNTGRDLIHLAELATGAVTVRFAQDSRFVRDGGGLPAVNGLRPDASSEIQYDGARNQTLYDQKAAVKPTPETVKEFKVVTNTVSAEYGKVGGTVVSMVSNSGTNEFHGHIWEYFQNEGMNANGFFANRSGLGKLPFTSHNTGAAVGGPIIKDKTFFYSAYELFYNDFAVPGEMEVPSLAERQGDFSLGDGPWGMQTIYDPFNVVDGQRQPFPGNRIPQDRIHPISRRVMDLVPFPEPNSSEIPNYNYQHATKRKINKFSTRVDHNFESDSSIFGRFSFQTDPAVSHGGAQNFYGGGNFSSYTGRGRVGVPGMLNGVYESSSTNDNGWQTMGGWVKPFGARVVNELSVSGWWFRGHRFTEDETNWVQEFGYDIADQVKLVAEDGGRGPGGLPDIRIEGYGRINGETDGRRQDRGLNLKDTLAWQEGNHYLKFGFEHIRYYDNQLRWVPSGSASNRFNGYITGQILQDGAGNVTGSTRGQPFADFLLGASSSVSANILGGGGYGTGSIRGIDTMSFYAFFLQDDWKVSPDLTVNLGVRWEIPLPATWFRDKTTCFFDLSGGRYGAVQMVPKGFPVDDDIVTGGDRSLLVIPHVERGSRACVDPHYKDFAPRIGIAWRMFGTNRTVLRLGVGTSFDQVIGAWYGGTGWLGHYAGRVSGVHQRGTNPDLFLGTYRTVPSVAASKIHPPGYQHDPSSSQTGQIYSYNLSIQHELMPGTKLEIAYVGNQGRHMRSSRGWNVAQPEGKAMFLQTGERLVATGSRQERRPYPQLDGNLTTFFDGSSNYNSLQMKVERNLRNGLSFSTGWTWGAAFITNTHGAYFSGVQNEFARHELNGRPRYNRTHSLYATLVYELPFFRQAQGLTRTLLGGWETTGIVTLASGAPYGVQVSSDLNDVGRRRLLLPNRTCNGNLSESQRTVTRFYDTSCFQPAPLGEWGNSAMFPLVADDVQMFDIGIHKKFVVGEGKSFDVRAEMFNAFNHTIFDTPGGKGGQDSVDRSGIGRVSGSTSARQIQISLRFSF